MGTLQGLANGAGWKSRDLAMMGSVAPAAASAAAAGPRTKPPGATVLGEQNAGALREDNAPFLAAVPLVLSHALLRWFQCW